MTLSEDSRILSGVRGFDADHSIITSSLTVPQALYVDKPAWDYANDEVSTYQFS